MTRSKYRENILNYNFKKHQKQRRQLIIPWFKLLSRLAMFLSMSSSIFWSSSRLAWWTNLETVGESKFPSMFSGDEYLTSKLTVASIGRFDEGSTRLSSTTTVPSLMRPDASRHGNWRVLKKLWTSSCWIFIIKRRLNFHGVGCNFTILYQLQIFSFKVPRLST